MKTQLLLALVPALLIAAGPEDAIRQAEKDWASAVVKKDYAVLDRVLANDLEYTHSDGRLDSKQSFMDNLRSGNNNYQAAEHQSIDVRLIAKDIALVRLKLRMVAGAPGKPATPANFSVLRVYQMKNGRWQMVGHQSGRLAQ